MACQVPSLHSGLHSGTVRMARYASFFCFCCVQPPCADQALPFMALVRQLCPLPSHEKPTRPLFLNPIQGHAGEKDTAQVQQLCSTLGWAPDCATVSLQHALCWGRNLTMCFRIVAVYGERLCLATLLWFMDEYGLAWMLTRVLLVGRCCQEAGRAARQLTLCACRVASGWQAVLTCASSVA